MKTALIIHGMPDETEYFSREYPSPSNSHWIPWLQHELIIAGYHTQTPEMPEAYHPDYPLWKQTFEQFSVNEDSLIIGHSCGAGFLLRYFSETKKAVKRIILVAPWLDPYKENNSDFFNFDIDPYIVNRTDLVVFNSDDDMKSVQTSVNIIQQKVLNFQYKEFRGYGHFCLNDLRTHEFKELLNSALS
jgi:hypothetical protein